MSSHRMQSQTPATSFSTAKAEEFSSIISDLRDRTGQLGNHISRFVQESHPIVRIPRATSSHEGIAHVDWLRFQMVAALDCLAHTTDRASRTLGRLRNAYSAINTLPDDILRLIFSHAVTSDIVPVASVCARWREVCLAAPEFWRYLGLANNEWSTSDYNRTREFVHLACLAGHPLSVTLDSAIADHRMAKLFRSVAHLVQDLEVRSWTISRDWFHYEFPRLESLSIEKDPYYPPCIFALPTTYDKLTRFVLHGSMLGSYRALRHYRNLTTLSLAYDERLNEDDLETDEPLSEVLGALPDLQCLKLHKAPMAPREVLSLSRAPRSPSMPLIPLLRLRDLHLAMYPHDLSALLRHIQTSPDNLARFSVALNASQRELGWQPGSPQRIAIETSFFTSPLRHSLPALSMFESFTVAFSCGVLPYSHDGAESRWGSLGTPATIRFHRPDYVESSSSPLTASSLQYAFDNLVGSILEQGPLLQVRTLAVQCTPTMVPTATQMTRVLQCVPRIRTLVLDVDSLDTGRMIERLVQARQASSVQLVPDIQLIVLDLRILDKDRLRGLAGLLKPLMVRKVAFVGLDLESWERWPPENKIVDSFKAEGLEVIWGAAQHPDTWEKVLAFGD
ncbi:hypothetical protein LXA43DRAFT_512399 [Ganoderma leucocontextum]|nr:hypothetical protein LXA43DRAFT_512399 [Ganoderma leucocontextum]